MRAELLFELPQSRILRPGQGQSQDADRGLRIRGGPQVLGGGRAGQAQAEEQGCELPGEIH